MGREARRVPSTWEHPRTPSGDYIPMYDHFPFTEEEVAEGLRKGWLSNGPPHYGCDIMPRWADGERTSWQMYENATEGTPISPVMGSPEALATWLVDHHVSAFTGGIATYEQWLATIRRGTA